MVSELANHNPPPRFRLRGERPGILEFYKLLLFRLFDLIKCNEGATRGHPETYGALGGRLVRRCQKPALPALE